MATDSPSPTCDLVAVAASARALAESSLRAGARPFALDLFADRDLVACAPAWRLRRDDFEADLLKRLAALPPAPVIYGGALENHPELLERIAATREILGNPAEVVRRARNPHTLATLAREQGLRSPESRPCAPLRDPKAWLSKPLSGSAGLGVRTARHDECADDRYLQRRVDGAPISIVACADGERTRVLGATRQLVGETWLGAPPYRWCGNVGPIEIPLPDRVAHAITRIARALDLRGIFGLDLIVDDGDEPWVLELNPRYTGSVEVLEESTGRSALALHLTAFRPDLVREREPRGERAWPFDLATTPGTRVAKTILYAHRSVVWWRDPDRLPDAVRLADLPPLGSAHEAGQPLVSVLSRAPSCDEALRLARVTVDRIRLVALRDADPASASRGETVRPRPGEEMLGPHFDTDLRRNSVS